MLSCLARSIVIPQIAEQIGHEGFITAIVLFNHVIPWDFVLFIEEVNDAGEMDHGFFSRSFVSETETRNSGGLRPRSAHCCSIAFCEPSAQRRRKTSRSLLSRSAT